jgi:hypothetical protein
MSDTPAVNETPARQRDPTLTKRRVVAIVMSTVFGAVCVALAILFYLKTDPLTATLPISVLNIPLWPLATMPMSLFFLIWIDYFMGTRIIAD